MNNSFIEISNDYHDIKNIHTILKLKNIEDYVKITELNYCKNIFKNDVYFTNNNAKCDSLKHKKLDDTYSAFYVGFKEGLLSNIRYDNIEIGYISNTSKFVLNFIDQHLDFTKKALSQITLDYFDKPSVLIGILDSIAYVDYNLASPELSLIAMSAMSNTDDEVVEYGIKCFENWRSEESLNILKNLKCREAWMNKYVCEIIKELEEELK